MDFDATRGNPDPQSRCSADRPDDFGCLLAAPDENAVICSPERPAAAKEENGFQQRRLATAIAADNDVQPRVKIQARRLKTAKMTDAQVGQSRGRG